MYSIENSLLHSCIQIQLCDCALEGTVLQNAMAKHCQLTDLSFLRTIWGEIQKNKRFLSYFKHRKDLENAVIGLMEVE